MGEVYRARDGRLSREVAIKVLPAGFATDSGFLARFQREAQALAALNHPNVAHLYGLEKSGEVDALVLELVEGETLAERIARGPIPVPEALEIARQIADALEAAHEKGIVHRDLKPSNVKLTPDGRVKVLDFGLAKAMVDDPASPDLTHSPTLVASATRTGVILGTAAYMSPEQAGGRPVDRRTDIWAFGAVLYEMLTGRAAFRGDTVSETLAAVLRDQVDWSALPAETPPAVRRVLKRCLDRNPKTRLHDIADARLEMDEAIEAGGPAEASAVVAAPRGRHAVWLIVGLASGAIVATLASGFWKPRPNPVRTMRFEVGVPSEVASYDAPRISPDGRTLAFDATDLDGKRRIWVRPLDALQAHPLAGTEGTGRVFWSPDSRYLGFFANRTLQKIDASGGSPQKICDAPSGVDGSWSSEGVIIFDASSAGEPIRRVPAKGGAAVPLVEPRKGRDSSVGVGLPSFMPDGKHFFYVTSSEKGESQLRLGTLDSKETQPIALGGAPICYVEPGYLLFLRGSTLVAQPFDAKSLKATGDPIPIVEHLRTDLDELGLFSVSGEGTLAYRKGQTTTSMAWVDRAGKELETIGDPGRYRDPALSHDAGRLAFEVIDEQEGKADIWVRDLKRNVSSRLTFRQSDTNMDATWSPNGDRIAYSVDRELIVRSADGQGPETSVFKSEETKYVDDWSADGRFIAFASVSKVNGTFSLWMLPTFGDRKPFVWLESSSDAHQAVFSPDGRYVAYVSTESGRAEVYVRSFPGPGGKWQISSASGMQPHWRADGRELFFLSLVPQPSRLMATDVATGAKFEAGVPKPLFPVYLSASARNTFLPSRDGQRFLLVATPPNEAAPTTIVLNWMADLGR
jgi:Tol biopolymer transport system component